MRFQQTHAIQMDGNCACGTCRWTLKGEDLLGLAGKRRPPALGSSPAPSHSAPANGSPCVSPSRGAQCCPDTHDRARVVRAVTATRVRGGSLQLMKAAFFDQSFMKLSGRNMIFQVKAPSSPPPPCSPANRRLVCVKHSCFVPGRRLLPA